MQLYFVKAAYSKNVYKIGDFFLNGEYKLVANKMLNINSRIPNEGYSFFITAKLELPDGTDIRDHTHIIVPAYNKIYKIINSQYINAQQYQLNLEEDPLIGNYQELKDTDIIINRTFDETLFRGVNDISDLTLEEEVDVKVISPDIKSGKWALLFFQYNPDDDVIGLKFDNTVYGQHIFETSLANLRSNYPEVVTDEPELYDYYQQTAVISGTSDRYQCVYRHATSSLYWVKFETTSFAEYYFDVTTILQPAKISKTDVFTLCIALPFETNIWSNTFSKYYLSYQQFIGPVDTSLIGIKIVNDLFLKTDSYSETYVDPDFKKTLSFNGQSSLDAPCYAEDTLSTLTDKRILSFLSFEYDIDVSTSIVPNKPRLAEPFYKYNLYIFGEKYSIPYKFVNDVRLRIAMNSGVINYFIYYDEIRNILASGSFTHAVKYQIDQLDAFYSENPTYKDQFYLKMGGNAFKTIAGSAVAGSIGGPLGIAGGAGVGAVTTGVDAGLAIANYKYMEKGLALKPDQQFGENAEISLQILNIFGIYWVIRTSENIDLMTTEFELKGFPTSIVQSIDESLFYTANTVDSGITQKIVFGELKKVIRNEFTTNFINDKLKEGIILIP